MKSPASLARKLFTKYEADPFQDLDEAAGRITDVVRYTMISNPDQVVSTVRTTVDGLADRDWTVLEIEQSYIDGNQYKALHLLARHPGGLVAEFQFR